MINSKYLASYLNDLLNSYGEEYSKYFKIFADEGELKKAVKEYGKQPKKFTNGIVEIMSSSLTPIRGIRLNTYSVQLTLYIDLAMDGFNEDKESLNLMTIRDNIISKIIEENNGTTTMPTIDNVAYSQSVIINYPTNGTKTELGYINDCLPIYWTFNFAMFEDGINANKCELVVNDIDIPFTRLVCTRKRTAEQDNFAGDSSSKVIMQMNGLSVDLVMPALLNNEFSNLVMADVLDGGNMPLSVKIKTPNYTKRFIGVLGDTQASLDIATNVGYNLSIVEGKPEILDYDSKWQIKEHKAGVTVVIDLEKKSTVYWGDGTAEELEAGTHSHTYTDNKTKHKIYIYGG